MMELRKKKLCRWPTLITRLFFAALKHTQANQRLLSAKGRQSRSCNYAIKPTTKLAHAYS